MEQKDLVSKISTLHYKLRKKRRENEGKAWDLVWKEHTEDFKSLKEYAEAMHKLATEIWNPRNSVGEARGNAERCSESEKLKCRLDWVYSKSREYFFERQDSGERRKLRLLDVGSCYNPFKKFVDFYDITAIDLCPAPGMEEDVFQCDFLKLKVGDREEKRVKEDGHGHEVFSLKKEDFDLIVFSFFLEYLPDKKQRLESCKKAVELLKPGGLLFILRPDSNSVTPTGNSRLCKGLKVGAGFLGLRRVYFEKSTHLWCMGFQKLDDKDRAEYLGGLRFLKDLKKVKEVFEFSESCLDELFSIPQDFSFKDGEFLGGSDEEGLHPASEEKEVVVKPELFSELPHELDSDDDKSLSEIAT